MVEFLHPMCETSWPGLGEVGKEQFCKMSKPVTGLGCRGLAGDAWCLDTPWLWPCALKV